MVRQLFLMRHAKSSWGTETVSDFDRPLTPKGEIDAPAMGRWLHERLSTPPRVISSPALRAKQTTLHVCSALNVDPMHIRWSERVYEASLSDLFEVLEEETNQDTTTVLLIGHNPGLETLVAHLCDHFQVPPDGSIMPTAAVAELSLSTDWTALDARTAKLVAITRPKT